MAVFRRGALIGAISGRVGGTTFVESRAGGVIRRVGRRTKRRSHEALLAQRQMQGSMNAWNGLDEENRIVWRRIGEELGVADRFGVRRPLTGYEAFVRFWTTGNLNTFGAGGIVPTGQYTPAELLVVGSFFAPGNYFFNVLPGASPVGVDLIVYGARQFRDAPGWTPRQWTYVTKVPRSLLPYNIYSGWAGRLGQMAQGEYYWLGVRSRVAGEFASEIVSFEGQVG